MLAVESQLFHRLVIILTMEIQVRLELQVN